MHQTHHKDDPTGAGGNDEPTAPRQAHTEEHPAVERLLVLLLLQHDHAERWSTPELARELTGIRLADVEAALANLLAKEIACGDSGRAWAAPPTRGLDALDMICI